MKTCNKCNISKPYNEFNKQPRNKDGHRNECKECRAKRTSDLRKTMTVDKKASEVYSAINDRLTNEKRLKLRERYRNVSNEITREDFVKWYKEHYFKGCSVDRIENDGNYTLDNIQMLSKVEHNHKKRLDRLGEYTFKENVPCSKCGKVKHISEFYKSKNGKNKYNPFGIRTACKECDKKGNK